MRYFFDNNISPRIARALAELERGGADEVVHLRDRFQADTPDASWMQSLGAEGGWTVVTCDTSIARNTHEVKAWLESGLRIFFLKKAWQSLGYWDFAWQLVKHWPMMKERGHRAQEGKGFIVSVRSLEIAEI